MLNGVVVRLAQIDAYRLEREPVAARPLADGDRRLLVLDHGQQAVWVGCAAASAVGRVVAGAGAAATRTLHLFRCRTGARNRH